MSEKSEASDQRIASIAVLKVDGNETTPGDDLLSVEEPLQIRLRFEEKGLKKERKIAVTMRTPGNDFELAAGFLFTEGILRYGREIVEIRHTGPSANPRHHRNRVTVRVKPGSKVNLEQIKRNFYLNSSCGICGKVSIERLQELRCPDLEREKPVVNVSVIHRLPESMREGQSAFRRTGGLHAAALFDSSGTLIGLQEDIGRHNAVDKLIGSQFLKNQIPLSGHILMVSGRISFELVQKALMAGIPMMTAVGAPSSLAAELALRYQMTLVGFVRNDRFNIYSGSWRILREDNKPDGQVTGFASPVSA